MNVNIPKGLEQSGGWEGPGPWSPELFSGPGLPFSPQPCSAHAHARLYLRMFTDNNRLQPPKADGSFLAIAALRGAGLQGFLGV